MDNQDLVEVVKGNNAFANKFYEKISKKQKGNIFFSPISVHTVLAMVYQGASGETANQFASILNVSNKEITENGYKNIIHAINTAKGVTLHIANKIYVRDDLILRSNFRDIITGSFMSEVESTDFTASKKAAKNINQWVESKTNSKIKNIVDPSDVHPSTSVILINAVYFKGSWLYPFNKHFTAIKPFYISNTRKVYCSMMFINALFQTREDEALDAKILEMNYIHENMSMVIILPNAKDGIASLESKLINVDLSTITRDMDINYCGTEVLLPKFKIETTMNLESVLTEMGLGVIFSDDADFSELTEGSLRVSKVIQKAYIEVNEKGTEAGAITSCEMFMSAPGDFIADHPFIILLQLKYEGLVNTIFYGKVMKPDY